jgi:RNA-directed DNA polymerase
VEGMERPNLKRCRLPARCRGREAHGPEATSLDKAVDAMPNVTTVQSDAGDGWAGIDWAAANRVVQRLQQRIFRASQQGRWRQVRNLRKLLLRSDANLVLSVRQVTQVNDGRATPGVDGRVAHHHGERALAAAHRIAPEACASAPTGAPRLHPEGKFITARSSGDRAGVLQAGSQILMKGAVPVRP